MRRVLILTVLAILLIVAADTYRLSVEQSGAGRRLDEEGLWSRLTAEAHAQKVREREEKKMAIVSVIMALLALGAACFTMHLCQRTHRKMARVEAGVLSADEKRRLAESASEVASLRHQVGQLQRTLQKQLEELKDSGKQLGEKVTGIEKACGGLAKMSGDLAQLKAFKDEIEGLHSRLRQAVNGNGVVTPKPQSAPRLGLPMRD
ncbi:MAG: hypothetical protein ACYTAS_23185 [Planctomycetota bacterium]|jgi:methyl-accepting chemotaxis protein